MEHLLSIKTVFPRKGGRIWYDDQREVHQQIYAGDDVVDYAFMGTDANSADNRWLLDAMREQIPVIYFLGTSPGRYQPIIPTFIVGWHPERLRVQLAFAAIVGASAQAVLPAAPKRRYALREVKARLHTKHRSEMPCCPPTKVAVRFLGYRNPGCSTPLTSSWMQTSSWGSRSSRTVSR
jgi:putative restriction endonuclease